MFSVLLLINDITVLRNHDLKVNDQVFKEMTIFFSGVLFHCTTGLFEYLLMAVLMWYLIQTVSQWQLTSLPLRCCDLN